MSTKTLKKTGPIALRYSFSGSNSGSAFSKNHSYTPVMVTVVDERLRPKIQNYNNVSEVLNAYEATVIYEAEAGIARTLAQADKMARQFVRENDLRNHSAFSEVSVTEASS